MGTSVTLKTRNLSFMLGACLGNLFYERNVTFFAVVIFQLHIAKGSISRLDIDTEANNHKTEHGRYSEQN